MYIMYNIYIYIISLPLSLYLSLYIYREREREGERTTPYADQSGGRALGKPESALRVQDSPL